jgi:hypothetical protein
MCPCSAEIQHIHKNVLDQDFCFDGLREEQVHRLALCIKAELKGHSLEQGRLLVQCKLLLGSSCSS